jgi:hypothetical protein
MSSLSPESPVENRPREKRKSGSEFDVIGGNVFSVGFVLRHAGPRRRKDLHCMLYIIEYNEVQDLRPEALNELVPCPKSDSFGTPPVIGLLAILTFAFVSKRMNSRSRKTFRSRSATSGHSSRCCWR